MDKGVIILEQLEDGKVYPQVSQNMAEDFNRMMEVMIMFMEKEMRRLVSKGFNKQEVFDTANVYFSSLLERFAPELELHPDISTEAFMQLEKEILEKRYNEQKGKL